MALEEQIIEWSSTRPPWQRVVLARVASAKPLLEQDLDRLVEHLAGDQPLDDVEFGLSQLPQVEPGDPPITLVSISDAEHVNALEAQEPLTFAPEGMTIVFGDNGSGKSGYARLLKRIARARHQEQVLSDVFRDTSLAQPSATLQVRVGEASIGLSWPEETPAELNRLHFYDDACGAAYIQTESDFPYRPSALFVMDGLIETCVKIRDLIDARLLTNAASSRPLPAVEPELRQTEVGKYLLGLSGSSSIETLDRLVEQLGSPDELLKAIEKEEALLRSEDPAAARTALDRQAAKLDSLLVHIDAIHRALSDEALEELRSDREGLESLEAASEVLSRAFESEPVRGVGSSPWRELWESARRFSESMAYEETGFPNTSERARCVLCLQELGANARGRFERFEQFVRKDTQTRLSDARRAWDRRIHDLEELDTSPEAVVQSLADLESEHGTVVTSARELISKYQGAKDDTLSAVRERTEIRNIGIDPSRVAASVREAAAVARRRAAELGDPAAVAERVRSLALRRKEASLLRELLAQRSLLTEEIMRRKERSALEEAKTAAATGPLTKKVLEFSETNITDMVRDTFTRLTDRLRLERVTIAKTRGDRGSLLHQPRLVGARQEVGLPSVLSEGERTALGIAAFLTECHLDASKSAVVLDDPVSSLDHIRRGLVATRLAELAVSRQVVVFTHDVSFVADLKREAKGQGVQIAERSVARARGGERKPGTCHAKHPWKTKDVPARLGELRNELARMRRGAESWEEAEYEREVALWAGNLSETWERVFSQEIVGSILAEGGLEVRPMMVKVIARFTEEDEREFQASYSRASQWAKRHDKSVAVNYVAPDLDTLEGELDLVDAWFRRVKAYKK